MEFFNRIKFSLGVTWFGFAAFLMLLALRCAYLQIAIFQYFAIFSPALRISSIQQLILLKSSYGRIGWRVECDCMKLMKNT